MKITEIKLFIANPGEENIDENFSNEIKYFGKN